jgi:hypothetical protein
VRALFGVLVCAAASAACISSDPSALPPSDASWTVLILALQEPGAPAKTFLVHASEQGLVIPPLVAKPDTTAFALYLRAMPTDARFHVGTLSVEGARDGTAPLRFAAAFQAKLPAKAADWIAEDTLASGVVGLPRFTLAECVAAGGCFDNPSAKDSAPFACSIPCANDPVAPPEPPAPTNPPLFAPCRAGWGQDPADEGACAPPARIACAGSTVQWIDTATCAAIDPPCADHSFAAGLPAGAIYVDPRAAGGDGSRQRPFSSIDIAVASSTGSAIIALSGDPHALGQPTSLSGRDITVWGACVDKTKVALPAGGLLLVGGQLKLRDLEVQSAAAIQVQAQLGLMNALITGSTPAIEVSGAGALAGDHLGLRGVACATLSIGSGGRAQLTSVVVESGPVSAACPDEAILISGPLSHLDANGLAVAVGTSTGISVQSGASLTGSGVLVEGARISGLVVHGATATVADGVLRAFDFTNGCGDECRAVTISGGDAAFQKLLVVIPAHYAIGLYGGRAAVSDAVLRGPGTDLPDSLQLGAISTYGSLLLERVVVSHPSFNGVWLAGDSSVTVRDLRVHDSYGDSYPLTLNTRAKLDAQRVTLAHVRKGCDQCVPGDALTLGESTGASITDLIIDDVDASGIVASDSSTITLARARITRTRQGITAYSIAKLSLSDVEVEARQSALTLEALSQVSLSRWASATGATGLCLVHQSGLHGTDVHVSRTGTTAATCSLIPTQGTGAFIADQTSFTLERFVIEDCPRYGIDLFSSMIDLHDGLFRANDIGVHATAPDLVADKIRRVAFSGERADFDLKGQ